MTEERSIGRRRAVEAWAVLLALVGVARPLVAQPAAAGPERVVAADAGAVFTYCPPLAALGAGAFALAWEETLFTGENFFRTLAVAVGGPRGEVGPARGVDLSFLDLLVPGELGGSGSHFALTWTRVPLAGGVASQQAVSLDEAGNVAGGEVAFDSFAAVSPRPGGGFVAVRRLAAAFAVEVLGADGGPLGSPAVVRDARAESWKVLHRDDGAFVVVWSSSAVRGRRTVSLGVKAQRFASDGRLQGRTSTLIPPPRNGAHADWMAAIGADGSLAMAYAVPGASPAAGYLRSYDPQGKPRGGPLVLAPGMLASGLAVDLLGRVLLVWAQPSGGESRVFGQTFTAGSQPAGPAFPLASEASATHLMARCPRAVAADGAWVVSWVGRDADGHDALLARRFGPG